MRTLRIAIDVTPIRAGGECGGAKPFVLDLLTGFAGALRRHEYRLLTAAHNHEAFAAYEELGMTTHCVDGLTPPIGLRASGTDLLFCPMTAPTFAEPGVMTACVLYDLQHLVYPWFFEDSERAHREQFYGALIERADHVVCISEFSRISLIRRLGMPPARTSVVPIAIHSRLPSYTVDQAWEVLAGSGLPRCRFAFYPANFWPHKNHRMLLVAFARFLKDHPESDLHLVLTGELLTEGELVRSAIARMGLTSRVHVLGFVPETQLAALWSAATLLVCPSLFEGFGIPVAEAMHFGKPVVCSREGSLPEIAGDEAVYCDPRNPQTLVDALVLASGSSDDLRDRATRARARLAAFRPGAVVERYLDVFDRVTPRSRSGQAPEASEWGDDGRLLAPADAQARYLEGEQNAIAGRLEEIAALRRALAESYADRSARLNDIHMLHDRLQESEADRAARLDVIHQQGDSLGRIPALEADIEFLTTQVQALRAEVQAEGRRRRGWRRFWPDA